MSGARDALTSQQEEVSHVNTDIIAGRWKEMKGKAKEQWGKITDDELERAEGKADQMIGLLQRHYGYARDKAEEEYKTFLDRYPAKDAAGKTRV